MARKSRNPESAGATVPAYIVTFSDMVTLLLTFFVMLLSMAQVQDAELFNKSRNAFKEYIDCYGLGMLTGKKIVPQLEQVKSKFNIDDPDEDVQDRMLDSNEETLRRLFHNVTQSMEALRSGAEIRLSDYTVSNIHFPPGQTAISESDKAYLDQFADGIRPQAVTGQIKLYVLGLAADEPTEKKQWVLSSLRAQTVAQYLEESKLDCPVYAWGGGSGEFWMDEGSPVSGQSQIYIAVLDAESMN